ncbi:MAG: family efflux transporter [Alphaproteobacteria bacterium]|nr:family efflux transporter [Alphaproteobacteria bacterium]MDB5723123.1 family efflux transporter [Alphaproteobacteria bacterium]
MNRDWSLHRAIWAIALPSMLTNVATALFGLADLWVIGRLGDPAAQGGVEIGAKFMMGLLVVFNFLRSGTIALTAQAAGRGDEPVQAETLARAIGAALLIGLALLALKPVLAPLGLDLLYARGRVAAEASIYIGIRYWSGPLWLLNAVLTGWMVGRRRVRSVLAVEVGSNLLHIALDSLFVLGFGWGVAGVATATFSSEAAKTLALALLVAAQHPASAAFRLAARRATWSRAALGALFRLNRDLFLRTLLLTASILALTRAGAHQGPLVLAANGVLYQLFMLSALILDGFESAAQVLCGEAIGAGDRARFGRLVRALLLWGLFGGALISAIYAIAGDRFAASFSTSPAVVATILRYSPWAILLPIAGVTSYIFDGIFIGATWTRGLMLSMVAASFLYMVLLLALAPFGNHGLWLAFTLFLLARAAAQAWLLPRLSRRAFADAALPAC